MKKIIGIMGPGLDATESDIINAFKLGEYCGKNGYITLTGGRNEGVMNSALEGAKKSGGMTVGILPNDEKKTFSKFVDIPIITNMRSGRNYINVLSSDVVIACGMNHGTASEISLAIKPGKPIILVGTSKATNIFFLELAEKQIHIARDYSEGIGILENILGNE